MKRKIDKIKNKRLVMGGGINNLSPNEILVEQKGDTISLKERVNGEIKEVSGGSNENSGSNIEYLDVSGLESYIKSGLIHFSVLAKIQGDSVSYGVHIQPSGCLRVVGELISLVTAVAIDLTIPITKYTSEESGVEKQELTTLGSESRFMEMLDAIPRITKEQFYSLE